MYEPLITFLDAILFPHEYPDLEATDNEGNWNWDKDTQIKAQGLKASLSSFQTISTFIITKNIMDEVKSLSSKLQKRDQDVFEALKMVNSVIQELKKIRSAIDTIFPAWYTQVLNLAESIGTNESVPRKTSLQRNRSNIPSLSPQEHYRRVIAIPVLDSLLSQLNERFHSDNNEYIRALLSLISSVLRELDSDQLLHLSEYSFTFWKDDHFRNPLALN